MMQRAFVQVGERRVHLRYAGKGAPILLVHQSPKSSAEFEALILHWSKTNLVIAPDTPGFGQSDPLPNKNADVTEFAHALLAFLEVLKIPRIAVYGFHSGAVFAVEAAKIAPETFSSVVCNGYAVWTEEEIKAFGEKYLPPFEPQPYGEHLTWLWARMREQRFFFPWYEVNDAHRIRMAEASPEHLHGTAMDMLYAGDHYRVGYGAVVRARRDLPEDSRAVPTLIVSFDGDPLRAHINRLGPLPTKWRVETAPSQGETEALAKQFLDRHAAPHADINLRSETSQTFIRHVHMAFKGAPKRLLLHGPGDSAINLLALNGLQDVVALDLPGHGLTTIRHESVAQTKAVLSDSIAALNISITEIIADENILPMVPDIGVDIRTIGKRMTAQHLTDITPDAHGYYMLAAWRRVRDQRLFDPWYDNEPIAARTVDTQALTTHSLARAHLAALQAIDGQKMLTHLNQHQENHHGNS